MFINDVDILLLGIWVFGFGAVVLLSALTFLAVVLLRRHRRWLPWVAAGAVVGVGIFLLIQIDASVKTGDAVATLQKQVGLPVTYSDGDSSLALKEDGTAELSSVLVGDDVEKNPSGMRCVSGNPTTITSTGRWWMDADGFAHIEADGKVTRLYPDGRLLLGYGWGKGFLLTTCDAERATLYLPGGRG